MFLISLILLTISFSGCTTNERTGNEFKNNSKPNENTTNLSGIQPKKRTFTISVDKTDLQYIEQKVWNDENYKTIIKNSSKYRKRLVKQFNSKFKVKADNFKVKIQEENRKTILSYKVHGKISKFGNRYTATFLWFLDPLNLDLLGNNFKETKKKLTWSGKVNGIPTSVIIDPPDQNSVYEAWGDPIGHCHGHVWWPEQS